MYRHYLVPIFFFAGAAFFWACNSSEKAENESEWIQLFNGENLNGWVPKITGYPLGENWQNTFTVDSGLLKVRYHEYDSFTNQFGHLFYNKSFSNYHLKVQYRFMDKQAKNGPEWGWKNSGVMLHCQSPESMGLNQDFPISLEAQFLGAHENEIRPTGNLCTPGTHVEINGERIEEHCITAEAPSIADDRWVWAEMIVYSDSIIHHVIDGDTVITYSKPVLGGSVVSGHDSTLLVEKKPLKSGYISLQSESHPIDFRVVAIRELKVD